MKYNITELIAERDKLAKLHAEQKKRGDLLQHDLNTVDEMHFDEVTILKQQIKDLEYKLRRLN